MKFLMQKVLCTTHKRVIFISCTETFEPPKPNKDKKPISNGDLSIKFILQTKVKTNLSVYYSILFRCVTYLPQTYMASLCSNSNKATLSTHGVIRACNFEGQRKIEIYA